MDSVRAIAAPLALIAPHSLRPASRVQLARTSGRLRSPSRPRSLVMHESLDEAELDDRERHDQDEEHDRFGARESELEVLERVEIDAVDERSRRVDGTASRQQMDLRECLQHGDGVDNE